MIRLADLGSENEAMNAIKTKPTKRRRVLKLVPPIQRIKDEIQVAYRERRKINAELRELRRLHDIAEKRQIREREAKVGAA